MDIKKELEQAIYLQRNADRLETEYLEAQKAASKKAEEIYKKLRHAAKPLLFYECLFGVLCAITFIYSGSDRKFRIDVTKIQFLSQQTEETETL